LSNNNVNKVIAHDFKIGEQEVRFSTGKLAKQANGSVLIECGGNGILITSTMSESFKEDIDYFPLIVDV
jgi:polyribonucleotide nucleotidyltransferase